MILPSYNSGPLLAQTARAALEHWKPVWIVLDGPPEVGDITVQVIEITQLVDGNKGIHMLLPKAYL